MVISDALHLLMGSFSHFVSFLTFNSIYFWIYRCYWTQFSMCVHIIKRLIFFCPLIRVHFDGWKWSNENMIYKKYIYIRFLFVFCLCHWRLFLCSFLFFFGKNKINKCIQNRYSYFYSFLKWKICVMMPNFYFILIHSVWFNAWLISGLICINLYMIAVCDFNAFSSCFFFFFCFFCCLWDIIALLHRIVFIDIQKRFSKVLNYSQMKWIGHIFCLFLFFRYLNRLRDISNEHNVCSNKRRKQMLKWNE